MAGTSRVDAIFSVTGSAGMESMFDVIYSQSVTKWTGKRHITLATGITDQSLIDIGSGGITTINTFMIVSDQNISVKFGTAGSNVALTLTALAPMLVSGIALTALSLSNASGNTANIDYALAGA